MAEQGQLSIHAENILPIIKKWLYTEKDIFLRELIANGTDAMQKLDKIALTEDVPDNLPEPKISVNIDKDKKTLTITDYGIGLTADECKKYINQVAFSGVQDFVEKYQDKDEEGQIIGHFGLGFYSSFMVADKVEIDSLSYKSGAKAIRWSCDGGTDFTINDSDRTTVGTSIILHIAEDSKEMLDASKIRTILNTYCQFMKYEVELEGSVVNDTKPIWIKSPTELNDKNYSDFFHKMFPMAPAPLFWIHLNVDFPFKLKGVLYFPKLQHELDSSQGEVKLFCNQVYVADNCKELIPEFLTLLKGAIDCPDLPLNVSRSNLQNDPQVRKISQHITKKVADKLTGLAKTDREQYEKFWGDINPFIKFGMMRDHAFYERMVDHLIFRTTSGSFVTLDVYQEKMKEKLDDEILYATDEKTQASYIEMYRQQNVEVIIADTMIDQHFLPSLEMQSSRKYKFKRIDADLSKHIVSDKKTSDLVDPKDNKTEQEKIEELFRQNITKEKVKIRVESLTSEKVPGMLIFDENSRRMTEMARLSGGMAAQMTMPPLEHTLVVNRNNPAVKNLVNLTEGNQDSVKLVIDQIYDLAYLQQGQLTPEMMRTFIDRSSEILERVGTSKSKSSIILEP